MQKRIQDLHGCARVLAAGIAILVSVQAQPPALPQPDVIFYGTVARSPGNFTVTPATVAWSLSGNGESVTAGNTTIVVVNNETFYLSHIPFETRRITGIAELPATPGTLELTTTDTTYTRHAEVDLDGTPRSAVLPVGKENLVYGTAHLGLVERLDLVIGETYAEWSQRIFGGMVDPGADADGDGRTNRDEFVQGTDPQASGSFSILRGFTASPDGGFTITWDSLPARRYTVETSPTLDEADWQPVGQPLPGTGEALQYTHPAGTAKTLFFRIVISDA